MGIIQLSDLKSIDNLRLVCRGCQTPAIVPIKEGFEIPRKCLGCQTVIAEARSRSDELEYIKTFVEYLLRLKNEENTEAIKYDVFIERPQQTANFQVSFDS